LDTIIANLNEKKVVVITGPTASGKTKLSIKLAEHFKSEIINADSRQVYRFMNVGTAKPTVEERNQIYHHFVDYVNPDEHFDAGLFGEAGRKVLDNLLLNKKIPIVVGGSGLYIRSLVDGLFEGPKQDLTIRKELDKRIEKDGIQSLLLELKQIDPELALKLLDKNKHRIIRAIEVYYITGKPITALQKENKTKICFYPIVFGLHCERNELYKKINNRVLAMISDGLIKEVKDLLDMRFPRNLKAFRTVGYKETIDYIDNKISYETMINQIQQYTRNYAKRQLTWFRADKRINWLDTKIEAERLIENVIKKFEESNSYDSL
jgi:tRNA dimethylallyltransferase